MAQIKINNIIYGSSNASDIVYKNITVEEKLDTIPIFDPSDNINIENAKYDYLTYGHIYDGLNSSDTSKILSANQGKVLNEKIDNVERTNNEAITALDNKITNDINDINGSINNINTNISNNRNLIDNNTNNINTLNTIASNNSAAINRLLKWNVLHFRPQVISNKCVINFNVPLDSGLCIISFRHTGDPSGGVAIYSFGYFPSLISTNFHNSLNSVSLEGTCNSLTFTINFGGVPDGHCDVAMLYPKFDYTGIL